MFLIILELYILICEIDNYSVSHINIFFGGYFGRKMEIYCGFS